MNDNITLEQAIQQNCINLLSHKDFGYKFISKEDNLIFRENKNFMEFCFSFYSTYFRIYSFRI